RPFGIVADADSNVLYENIRRIDLQRCPAQRDARRRCSLTGDRDVWIPDVQVGRELDRARHLEDADARTACLNALLQGASSGFIQVRDTEDFTAAACRRLHSITHTVWNDGKRARHERCRDKATSEQCGKLRVPSPLSGRLPPRNRE